jgi:hypothetical protein
MADVAITKVAIPNCINASTDKVIVQNIRYSDIINGGTFADNDTASFTIPVSAGDTVLSASVKLIAAFTDSGSGDELNVEVGDGADADGYIATAQLHDSATEISTVYGTGDLLDGTTSYFKHYTADDTLDILVTPNVSTGTDYNLGELTAGEFEVKVVVRSA